jgi:hypothetical protein
MRKSFQSDFWISFKLPASKNVSVPYSSVYTNTFNCPFNKHEYQLTNADMSSGSTASLLIDKKALRESSVTFIKRSEDKRG